MLDDYKNQEEEVFFFISGLLMDCLLACVRAQSFVFIKVYERKKHENQ